MDTDTITAHAAVQKVFYLPELLAHILSFLPWSNLFVLQRVNSTFTSTISKFPTLRERQRLHNIARSPPGGGVPSYFTGLWPVFDVSPAIPELLFSGNPAPFDPAHFKVRHTTTSLTICLCHHVRPSPRHQHHRRFQHPSGAIASPGAAIPGTHRPPMRTDLRYQSLSRAGNAAVVPEGSWRRLRLSIPPVETMSFHIVVALTPGVYPGNDMGGASSSLTLSTSTHAYLENIEVHSHKADFGDLVDLLRKVTSRRAAEHAWIRNGLGGAQWVQCAKEGVVSAMAGDGRPRIREEIVGMRSRRMW